MRLFADKLTDKVLHGKDITLDEAGTLMGIKGQKDLVHLLSCANIIRDEFKGNAIDFCSIINAKSGKCSEDCTFCSQSAHYNANIKSYPLIAKEEIIKKAQRAASLGINRFSIVVSGRALENKKEWDNICEAINVISSTGIIKTCASLGTLTREAAGDLKKAGLTRYHHNLETAESYFSTICTTHPFSERVNTVIAAHEEGLEVCSGGLMGLGETLEQRIELAFALRDLAVDSIPINTLNPIAKTPLEKAPPVHPMEILKIIAIYRFINPKKGIRLCGGREKNLRSVQTLIFFAGANGVMTGDYLTTPGCDIKDDMQMIKDLMLTPVGDGA